MSTEPSSQPTRRLAVVSSRIRREQRTVTAMIELYCHDLHGSDRVESLDGSLSLCDECRALHTYAMHRLERCPFQEGKTTCAKCRVHCYRPQMREQIRVVMRYSGPRMLWRHPVMAVQHLLDGRRDEAFLPPKPAPPSPE